MVSVRFFFMKRVVQLGVLILVLMLEGASGQVPKVAVAPLLLLSIKSPNRGDHAVTALLTSS
jgi:hypothetical protein